MLLMAMGMVAKNKMLQKMAMVMIIRGIVCQNENVPILNVNFFEFLLTFSTPSLFRESTETDGDKAVSEVQDGPGDHSVHVHANAGAAIDPLDPNFINFDIDYGNKEEYLKLKRRLSVQKDAALIVKHRKKAEASIAMAAAQKEIIR